MKDLFQCTTGKGIIVASCTGAASSADQEDLRFARAVRADYQIAEEDILILRANPDDLKSYLDKHELELRSTASPTFIQPSPDNEIMAEGVVRNDSPLIGKGIEFIKSGW